MPRPIVRPTSRARIAAALGFGLVAMASLAACGAESASPAQPPVVVTAPETTAEPVPPITTTLPPTTITETVAPVTTQTLARPTTRPCGPIPDATARIADATARIAPPSSTLPYRWSTLHSSMSTCNQLSWAELTTAHGTASSADQLLLFGPDGTWLGTGIRCTMSLASVFDSGPDHVDVNYLYHRTPNEGTANASGRAVIRFRWNGSRVVMEGSLPAQLMSDQCPHQQ